jgi:hypothetical protein
MFRWIVAIAGGIIVALWMAFLVAVTRKED